MALALLALTLAVPARADDDFVAGSGSAAASSVQIGPKAGGLALTILFGESVAGYIGTAAQATSQTIDMGLLGTLLSAKQCDGSPGPLPPDQVPKPLRADSRDQDPEKERTSSYGGTQPGSPVQVTVGHEQVSASRSPSGHSRNTLALASIPGVVEVHGGAADTETGLVKNASRTARASVDLGDLDLFGGVITLSHLRWTASQQTGKGAADSGAFTIGSATIAGRSLPTSDPSAVIDTVSKATSQIGVTLEPPKVSRANGVVQVSPLVVHLQSSPTQQQVISPLLVALQPARQAVTAAITATSCRWQTLITVADVSVGPTTGSGAFELGFGGAAATTDGTRFANPFGDAGSGTTSLLPAGLAPPGTASVLGDRLAARTFSEATAGTSSGGTRRTRRGAGSNGLLAGTRSLPGSTGGWAVLIGFLAVAGVVAVAGADWLRVRRPPPGDAE
jgi:hypothetical protein